MTDQLPAPIKDNEIQAAEHHAGLLAEDPPATARRAIEYLTVTIRNANTRNAYKSSLTHFFAWAQQKGILSVRDVQPIHLAAYVEQRTRQVAASTVKCEVAALRGLFAYLNAGGLLGQNPAADLKAPRVRRTEGKTPALAHGEAGKLLATIPTDTLKGLRDRAIIGLMLYSACRVSAVAALKVEDFYQLGTSFYTDLQEKGGQERTLIMHHKAAEYTHAYIVAAGIADQPKTPLFRTMSRRSNHGQPLGEIGVTRRDILNLVKIYCGQAGLSDRYSPHSFRATAITSLLNNGCSLDEAQRVAGHADPRTTQLYDRRSQTTTAAVIERINYDQPARGTTPTP